MRSCVLAIQGKAMEARGLRCRAKGAVCGLEARRRPIFPQLPELRNVRQKLPDGGELLEGSGNAAEASEVRRK